MQMGCLLLVDFFPSIFLSEMGEICYYIKGRKMASVAKWLRQWIVVPPLGGSSPLIRPQGLSIDRWFKCR
jgi:hypothetical protein